MSEVKKGYTDPANDALFEQMGEPTHVPFQQQANSIEKSATFHPESKQEMLKLFEVVAKNNYDKVNPWSTLLALAENHKTLFNGALLKDPEVLSKAREAVEELHMLGMTDLETELKKLFPIELPN